MAAFEALMVTSTGTSKSSRCSKGKCSIASFNWINVVSAAVGHKNVDDFNKSVRGLAIVA